MVPDDPLDVRELGQYVIMYRQARWEQIALSTPSRTPHTHMHVRFVVVIASCLAEAGLGAHAAQLTVGPARSLSLYPASF